MVSVTHAISDAAVETPLIDRLCEGLDDAERQRIEQAVEAMQVHYQDAPLGTSEPTLRHALGTALVCVSLKMDVEAR
ncbi:MAG: GTP pyrophosphokinase, partial [Rhodocyclaceae bacterium]|nr:GTP pyrophosphokinase [Rhodocyclaceae bacterium]